MEESRVTMEWTLGRLGPCGDINLERDTEGAMGLGAGEVVSLTLDLPAATSATQLEPGDREAGCQHIRR